mmetsp:Transcript_49484/g.159789  ORF Transcript_49484/g.159789 Transcript_49484/m.159789 type:complete len:600 (+) Transcript_49484:2380-4179(+)
MATTALGSARLVFICSTRKAPALFRSLAGSSSAKPFQEFPSAVQRWAEPASVVTSRRSAPAAQPQPARQKSSWPLTASPCQGPRASSAAPSPKHPCWHLALQVRFELPSHTALCIAEGSCTLLMALLLAWDGNDGASVTTAGPPAAAASRAHRSDRRSAQRREVCARGAADRRIAWKTAIAPGSPKGSKRAPVEFLTHNLRQELIRSGFVNEETNQLTTGNNPFNVFAKCAAGALQQPNMAAEQALLGKFKDEFMICSNRPENDEHWDSEDPEWVGKASMSRRHRFLTSRDLHFQWFNALLFGLVEQDGWGGVSKVKALAQIEKMKAAALKYATAVEGWSDKIGIFFHVFGHNSVNSLHLHILDMKELGPTFWRYEYKNCPIDAVIKVLKEEIDHEQGAEGRLQRLELAASQAALAVTEAASLMVERKSTSQQHSKWQGSGSGDVVQLNVGGEPVSIAKETLQIAPKGSLLREMFNDRWDGHQHQFDAEGRVFLNFPSRAFKIIADHLRLLHLTPRTALLNPPRVPWELQDEVLELSWLLGVHPLIDGPQWGRGESRGLPPKPRPPSRFCGRRRPPPPPPLRVPAEQPSDFSKVSIDVS